MDHKAASALAIMSTWQTRRKKKAGGKGALSAQSALMDFYSHPFVGDQRLYLVAGMLESEVSPLFGEQCM